MYSRKGLFACLLVVCLGVPAVLACGPNFPWQLLDNRAHTLKATPVNSFDFEAERLAPTPSDSLRAVENQDQNAAEMENLSAIQAYTVRRMREAPTGDAAYANGADIPSAILLYTAGAVAFYKEDEKRAVAWFQSILDLPEDEQRARATWAAYMLGRSYGRLGDIEKASEAFTRTRELALKGVPDPLGLAVASYGEEAKLHLDRAKNVVTTSESSAEVTIEYTREMTAAVALYAEQAARGSWKAIQSLRSVAKRLLHNTPERLAAAVVDPTVQRLLVAYVLARYGDFPEQSYWTGSRAHESNRPPNPLFVTLVEAIEQGGLEHLAGADRLAALAYSSGRYDLAARLTTNTSGPLASWVKAKLALQKGDLTAAATLYAKASKAFPSSDEAIPLDRANVRRLAGERGVLMLARGEYVEALAQLYPVAATYWGDVAYLADRVLTVDELQHFIDTRVSPPQETPPEQRIVEESLPSEEEYFRLRSRPTTRLRDLLARRLVRAGRYQEALAYFHAPDATDTTDPDIRTQVAAYAQALQEAENGWWPVERAQAWYRAAVLARKFGMEMMGTEAAPDFFAHGGYFDFGIGQTPSAGPFITEGELERFSASTANPNLRFHYRYLAVEHGVHAADLLPPRSQAFAAALCRATGWTVNEEPQRAREFYQRYVQHGPYVPWAAHFGRNCPEPNFTAAACMVKMQPFHDARQFARRYRWLIGGGLVAVIGAIIAWRARQMATTRGT